MFIVFSIIISISAFAQTSFFSAQGTMTRNNATFAQMEYYASVTLGKNSRTWELTKCPLPKNNECNNFKVSLVQETNGKWYWVEPGIKSGTVLKTLAKVQDDHLKLHSFKVSGINDFNKPWSLEHNKAGDGFIWKELSSDRNGPLELKIIFTPITEKIYRETLGKKIIKKNL